MPNPLPALAAGQRWIFPGGGWLEITRMVPIPGRRNPVPYCRDERGVEWIGGVQATARNLVANGAVLERPAPLAACPGGHESSCCGHPDVCENAIRSASADPRHPHNEWSQERLKPLAPAVPDLVELSAEECWRRDYLLHAATCPYRLDGPGHDCRCHGT